MDRLTMYLLTAISCCLLVGGLAVPLDVAAANSSSSDSLLPTNDTQIIFGEEMILSTNTRNIWHMEHDLYLEPGSILFAWGSSLKTARAPGSSKEMKNEAVILDVVGSIDTWGYGEGSGTEAKFNLISNFIQTSRDKVVIVDRYNGCLRELDRTTGVTSKYAGQCANRGYADGDADTAQFYNPSDVLMDERTNKALIVVDEVSHALRSVDMGTRYTTTIIQNDERIMRPRSATFDIDDKNILYLTVKFQIVKVSLSDKSVSVIFGERIPHQFQDGPFNMALLGYWPAEIVMIDSNHLAVADYWNHEVRVIDLVDQKVTSLCPSDPRKNFTAPGILECELQNPHSLLLHNDTLYVGDTSQIHTYPVMSVPSNGKPDTFGQVCETRTITAAINDGETMAKVQINSEHTLLLSAGSHEYVYTVRGLECTVNIEVKANQDACPASISRVASPGTNSAVVELVIGNLFQQFVLPVGRHPYQMKKGDLSCSFNLDVYDADMERRIVFEVQYKFNCAELSSNDVASKLVKSTMRHNYVYILELCNGVCNRENKADPSMTCNNGTLTVTYPTDLSYGGDIFDIPNSVKQTLTDRLIAKGTMMSIVDTTRIPPVVFPITQPDGSSAKVLLKSSCMNSKVYDANKDACM